jgi:presenilin-like A22 family membrane protease
LIYGIEKIILMLSKTNINILYINVSAGSLGTSATWGITISALCLLALLIIVAIRYAQPQVLSKASSKTAHQGMTFSFRNPMLIQYIYRRLEFVNPSINPTSTDSNFN